MIGPCGKGLLFDLFHELQAVHDRHIDIEKDKIENTVTGKDVERLQPVHGINDLALRVFIKNDPVHGMDQLGVIYNKHFC